jgi:hypothetical protein
MCMKNFNLNIIQYLDGNSGVSCLTFEFDKTLRGKVNIMAGLPPRESHCI